MIKVGFGRKRENRDSLRPHLRETGTNSDHYISEDFLRGIYVGPE